jgi:hypothetical protein
MYGSTQRKESQHFSHAQFEHKPVSLLDVALFYTHLGNTKLSGVNCSPPALLRYHCKCGSSEMQLVHLLRSGHCVLPSFLEVQITLTTLRCVLELGHGHIDYMSVGLST